MSFIDKDQRITSWQTKTKHNFIETSISDLFCFVQWQTSLALTSRPYIRRLFLFFLPPRFVYISALPNCSEPAFVLGFNVEFGPTCLPLFCSYRLPVELLMFRKPTKLSCFLEDIRVSFDCKQQISTKH